MSENGMSRSRENIFDMPENIDETNSSVVQILITICKFCTLVLDRLSNNFWLLEKSSYLKY